LVVGSYYLFGAVSLYGTKLRWRSDSDWNGGKGSGSDGTESVVELVGSADTLAGRSSEWKTVEGRSLKMKKSLEMKKSPEERKQINTKVSCDKDYN
jgi:hypothetical protein